MAAPCVVSHTRTPAHPHTQNIYLPVWGRYSENARARASSCHVHKVPPSLFRPEEQGWGGQGPRKEKERIWCSTAAAKDKGQGLGSFRNPTREDFGLCSCGPFFVHRERGLGCKPKLGGLESDGRQTGGQPGGGKAGVARHASTPLSTTN